MARPSRHVSSLALGCGLVLSLSLLSSCGPKPWKRLGVKTMQELLPEMVIAEQNFAERSLPDSLRLVGYATILGRHDATLADWDSSLVWYSQHDLESYKDIYDAAHKELEQRRQLLQARSDSLSTLQAKLWQWQAGNVDSVNLLRDSVSFHAGKAYLERSFSYTPDQSYAAGTELAFVLRGSPLRPSERYAWSSAYAARTLRWYARRLSSRLQASSTASASASLRASRCAPPSAES